MGAALFKDSYARWRDSPSSENCSARWPFEEKCTFTGTCVESGTPDVGICLCGTSWIDPSAIVRLLSDLKHSSCTMNTWVYILIHAAGLIASIILGVVAIEKFRKVITFTAVKAMIEKGDITEKGPIRDYVRAYPPFRSRKASHRHIVNAVEMDEHRDKPTKQTQAFSVVTNRPLGIVQMSAINTVQFDPTANPDDDATVFHGLRRGGMPHPQRSILKMGTGQSRVGADKRVKLDPALADDGSDEASDHECTAAPSYPRACAETSELTNMQPSRSKVPGRRVRVQDASVIYETRSYSSDTTSLGSQPSLYASQHAHNINDWTPSSIDKSVVPSLYHAQRGTADVDFAVGGSSRKAEKATSVPDTLTNEDEHRHAIEIIADTDTETQAKTADIGETASDGECAGVEIVVDSGATPTAHGETVARGDGDRDGGADADSEETLHGDEARLRATISFDAATGPGEAAGEVEDAEAGDRFDEYEEYEEYEEYYVDEDEDDYEEWEDWAEDEVEEAPRRVRESAVHPGASSATVAPEDPDNPTSATARTQPPLVPHRTITTDHTYYSRFDIVAYGVSETSTKTTSMRGRSHNEDEDAGEERPTTASKHPLLHILWHYPDIRRLWWHLLIRSKIFQVSAASLLWTAYSSAHCLYFLLHLISWAAGYPSFSPDSPLINSTYFGLFMGFLNASLAVCIGVLLDLWNIALYYITMTYGRAVAYCRHLLWFCDNYDYLIRVYLNYYLYCYTHKVNITNHGDQVFEFLDAAHHTDPADHHDAAGDTGFSSGAGDLSPADATSGSGSAGSNSSGSLRRSPSKLDGSVACSSRSGGSQESLGDSELMVNLNLLARPHIRVLDAPLASDNEADARVASLHEDAVVDVDDGRDSVCVGTSGEAMHEHTATLSTATGTTSVLPADMSLPTAHSYVAPSLSMQQSLIVPSLSEQQYNTVEAHVFNLLSSLHSTHICQPRYVHSTMFNIYKALGEKPIMDRCLNDGREKEPYHPYNITYNAISQTVVAHSGPRVVRGAEDEDDAEDDLPRAKGPLSRLGALFLTREPERTRVSRTRYTKPEKTVSAGFWSRLWSAITFQSKEEVVIRVGHGSKAWESASPCAASTASARTGTAADSAQSAVKDALSDGDESESTDDDEALTTHTHTHTHVQGHSPDLASHTLHSGSPSRTSRCFSFWSCSDDTVQEAPPPSSPSTLTDPHCRNCLPPVVADGWRYFPRYKRPFPDPFKSPHQRFKVIRAFFVLFFMFSFFITVAVVLPTPVLFSDGVSISVLLGGIFTVSSFFGMMNVSVYLGLNLLPTLFWSKFDGNEVIDLLKLCDRLAYIRAGEILVLLRNRIKSEGMLFATFFAHARVEDLRLREPFHSEAHLEDVIEEDYPTKRVSLTSIPEDDVSEATGTTHTSNSTATADTSVRPHSSQPFYPLPILVGQDDASAPMPAECFPNTVFPKLVEGTSVNTQQFMAAMGALALQTWKAEYAVEKPQAKADSLYTPTYIPTQRNTNAKTAAGTNANTTGSAPNALRPPTGPLGRGVAHAQSSAASMGSTARRLQVLFLRVSPHTHPALPPHLKAGKAALSRQTRPSSLHRRYLYRHTQQPDTYQDYIVSSLRASSVPSPRKHAKGAHSVASRGYSDVGYDTKRPTLRCPPKHRVMRRHARGSVVHSDVPYRGVQSLQSSVHSSNDSRVGSATFHSDQPTRGQMRARRFRGTPLRRRWGTHRAQEDESDDSDDDSDSSDGGFDFDAEQPAEPQSRGPERKVMRNIDFTAVDFTGFQMAGAAEFHVEKEAQMMAVVDVDYCLIHARVHKHRHRCNRSQRKHNPYLRAPRAHNIYEKSRTVRAPITPRSSIRDGRAPALASHAQARPHAPREACVAVDGNFDASASTLAAHSHVSARSDSASTTTEAKSTQVLQAESLASSVRPPLRTTSPAPASSVVSQLLSSSSDNTANYYSCLPALAAFTNTSARLVYPTLVLPSVLNLPLPIPNTPFPPPFVGSVNTGRRDEEQVRTLLKNTDEYTSETETDIVTALKVCVVSLWYCSLIITPSAAVPIIRDFFILYAAGNVFITSLIMWKMLRLNKDDTIKKDRMREVMAKLTMPSTKRILTRTKTTAVRSRTGAQSTTAAPQSETGPALRGRVGGGHRGGAVMSQIGSTTV